MSLKVFDLECEHGHLFEGWFASHDDYDRQQSQGLLSCPVCPSVHITKRLSAPRLNLGHYTPSHESALEVTSMATTSTAVSAPNEPTLQEIRALQARMIARMREVVLASENVGTRFAQEARAIHAGDSPQRAIRGIATPDERQALNEEGIMVVTVPDFLDTSKLQ